MDTYDYYKGIEIAFIGIADKPNSWIYFEFPYLKVKRHDIGLTSKILPIELSEQSSLAGWIQGMCISYQHDLEIKLAAEKIFHKGFKWDWVKWYNLSIKSIGEKITEDEYNEIKKKNLKWIPKML